MRSFCYYGLLAFYAAVFAGTLVGHMGEMSAPLHTDLFVGRGSRLVPPRQIPEHLRSDYTLNGKIPVKYRYWNNSYSPSKPRVYTKAAINQKIAKALKNGVSYYGVTDKFLYAAMRKFPIKGKAVAVLGSVTPWYESIVLSRGGRPVTIEYNKIISEDPRLEVMTVDEYDANPRMFDALLSISSFEHDGLGRYGDPIDPFADCKAMEKCKKMLNPGGVLFLAVPSGPDCLLWNGCRIYGKLRMKMLQQGWRVLGYYGKTGLFEQDIKRQPLGGWSYQPVFVLTPEDS